MDKKRKNIIDAIKAVCKDCCCNMTAEQYCIQPTDISEAVKQVCANCCCKNEDPCVDSSKIMEHVNKLCQNCCCKKDDCCGTKEVLSQIGEFCVCLIKEAKEKLENCTCSGCSSCQENCIDKQKLMKEIEQLCSCDKAKKVVENSAQKCDSCKGSGGSGCQCCQEAKKQFESCPCMACDLKRVIDGLQGSDGSNKCCSDSSCSCSSGSNCRTKADVLKALKTYCKCDTQRKEIKEKIEKLCKECKDKKCCDVSKIQSDIKDVIAKCKCKEYRDKCCNETQINEKNGTISNKAEQEKLKNIALAIFKYFRPPIAHETGVMTLKSTKDIELKFSSAASSQDNITVDANGNENVLKIPTQAFNHLWHPLKYLRVLSLDSNLFCKLKVSLAAKIVLYGVKWAQPDVSKENGDPDKNGSDSDSDITDINSAHNKMLEQLVTPTINNLAITNNDHKAVMDKKRKNIIDAIKADPCVDSSKIMEHVNKLCVDCCCKKQDCCNTKEVLSQIGDFCVCVIKEAKEKLENCTCDKWKLMKEIEQLCSCDKAKKVVENSAQNCDSCKGSGGSGCQCCQEAKKQFESCSCMACDLKRVIDDLQGSGENGSNKCCNNSSCPCSSDSDSNCRTKEAVLSALNAYCKCKDQVGISISPTLGTYEAVRVQVGTQNVNGTSFRQVEFCIEQLEKDLSVKFENRVLSLDSKSVCKLKPDVSKENGDPDKNGSDSDSDITDINSAHNKMLEQLVTPTINNLAITNNDHKAVMDKKRKNIIDAIKAVCKDCCCNRAEDYCIKPTDIVEQIKQVCASCCCKSDKPCVDSGRLWMKLTSFVLIAAVKNKIAVIPRKFYLKLRLCVCVIKEAKEKLENCTCDKCSSCKENCIDKTKLMKEILKLCSCDNARIQLEEAAQNCDSCKGSGGSCQCCQEIQKKFKDCPCMACNLKRVIDEIQGSGENGSNCCDSSSCSCSSDSNSNCRKRTDVLKALNAYCKCKDQVKQIKEKIEKLCKQCNKNTCCDSSLIQNDIQKICNSCPCKQKKCCNESEINKKVQQVIESSCKCRVNKCCFRDITDGDLSSHSKEQAKLKNIAKAIFKYFRPPIAYETGRDDFGVYY
ncbi:uncharacterized protein BdWA1_004150 [Babesia duncani]|uniref:Uncharacterized protein n=1 Tax=Babesia duncani TaxID=323732 RepID=A0AAD9PH86_9APIC|nr:hypothetical protein BdWA1_004150 [Babesia duncani]